MCVVSCPSPVSRDEETAKRLAELEEQVANHKKEKKKLEDSLESATTKCNVRLVFSSLMLLFPLTPVAF